MLALDLYDELNTIQIITPPRVQLLKKMVDYMLSSLIPGERALLMQSQEKTYQQARINETIQLYKEQGPDSSVSPSLYFFQQERALIGKVRTDIEAFSFNTAVSAFMIAVNELTDLKCSKREILEQLIVLLSPFAPHVTEELWEALGHKESITFAAFPEYVEAYTIENNCTYAVSFNGKTRFTVELPLDMSREDVDAHVRGLEQTAKYVGEGNIVKVIVVPGKIVNIVVK